ncbi:hypothetical protein SAMN04488516_11737 [Desulfonauticus submarinus]|uniref:Uncharacterized protein n=1 Tax=Desulfonauticus submarinus TaxID=206665 RepID=A0A1H0GBW9_9BACT|nr:hypothetical protein [Desulfonauticus submarinus]SDO04334.1 hypothetical protein SAMN04488516_11737 [Desulfonauticus submarinus]
MLFFTHVWASKCLSVWMELVFGELRSRERIVRMTIARIIITGARRIERKNKSVMALAHITPLSAR